MKKIGHGVQYNTYDLENGRVRKVETNILEKITRFHKIAPKYRVYPNLIHNIKTGIGAYKKTRDSMIGLRKHLSRIDGSLLGNPTLINSTDYEQDKVIPLGEKISSSKMEEQKELIDKYIQNLLTGWEYGFSDTVFNFTINSGVTSGGDVILIDLGELVWDKEPIKQLVKNKHWEKRSSFNKLESAELKIYLQKKFNESVTELTLDKLWASKLNSGSNLLH
jgi:hypothetical protein